MCGLLACQVPSLVHEASREGPTEGSILDKSLTAGHRVYTAPRRGLE